MPLSGVTTDHQLKVHCKFGDVMTTKTTPAKKKSKTEKKDTEMYGKAKEKSNGTKNGASLPGIASVHTIDGAIPANGNGTSNGSKKAAGIVLPRGYANGNGNGISNGNGHGNGDELVNIVVPQNGSYKSKSEKRDQPPFVEGMTLSEQIVSELQTQTAKAAAMLAL